MALRIPWDKQETAILIDAYIQVKNKTMSQKEAVAEVSGLLRKRAILSGVEIDEVYRNENGIRLQMMGIQGLMECSDVGLKNTSKLFAEMVDMYKTQPIKFLEILTQAKEACGMQINNHGKPETLSWKFSDKEIDFSTMRPIEISYFGEVESVIDWKDVFEKIVCFLQEDYPDIIQRMVGHHFDGIGKFILSDKIEANIFTEAKELNDGLYLERGFKPDEIVTIVRLLMDKCNMDYDNIEITYEQCHCESKNLIDSQGDLKELDDSKQIYSEQDEIKKNRIAFIAWAQAQQMQKAAILAYLSIINECSNFVCEYGYTKEKHIFLIKDVNILKHIFLLMQKDSRFIKFSNERKKYPAAAMKKLIAFRIAVANEVKNKAASQDLERYATILTEYFADGFRPDKAIDRNRFRLYYSDMFEEEIQQEDELLVRTIMKAGTLRNERIFVKDEIEQKALLEEINKTIEETFKKGASCIYLDCIFSRFKEKLADMLNIYSVEALVSVLFNSGKRNYYNRYNYLFKYDKEPEPAKDVLEYMKKSYLPVTYSEFKNSLWYIPLDKVKHILRVRPSIVKVASEAYLYAPNLPVSEEEIQQITELISHELLQHSYITDKELKELIDEHCPSVFMNTQGYPLWGIRNAFAYLLRDKFSFKGAIISSKSEELSKAKVFSEFCQRSERTTIDELKHLADELNTQIYWDSVYSEMVRINQSEFICKDMIHFDVEETDKVLNMLIQNSYTSIKAIDLFLHFPTIEVPWNNYVLESYVANYSRKFRLIHADYTATDCCGAIVKRESDITDYRTLVVNVLMNNSDWKNKSEALNLLADLGYQKKRTYSDIERVMREAKARTKKLQAKK